jgi:hypothetical protein
MCRNNLALRLARKYGHLKIVDFLSLLIHIDKSK